MCLIVFLISCFLQCSIADEILLWKSKRTFIEADCIKNYRYLISNFAENKILLKDIELASLVALSYFPELKNIEIEFVLDDIKTTMETRPKINYLLSFNKKRKYVIYVDSIVKLNYGILIDQVPFNALIGLIGHELSHIVDYERRGILNLLSLLFNYSDLEFKKNFEEFIDLQTINKGLAWQLYDWADFAMCKSNASEKYKNFKMALYMDPVEIEKFIVNN